MSEDQATHVHLEPARGRIDMFFSCSRHDQVIEKYSPMAQFYDQDMIALGFTGYEPSAKKVMEVLRDKSANILDLGCGSGLFGKKLKSLGYDNVYGVDGNADIVEIARQKNSYRGLEVVDLVADTHTPFSDGFFDAVVGISVFAPTAITHTAFPEISRIIRRGGFLIGFFRESRWKMESEDFHMKAVIDGNVARGLWKRFPDEVMTEPFYRKYESAECPNDKGVVVTIQRC